MKIYPMLRREAALFREALFRSYSIVFFSRSCLFGAAVLVATFSVPKFGLMGVAGVTVAYIAARMLGFDCTCIRKGLFLFNSLLVSLSLAYLESYQPLDWQVWSILLVIASVGTLLVSVAMADLSFRYFALPALSLPFTGVAFLLFYLFHALSHVPLNAVGPVCLFPVFENFPVLVEGFLQALGAIFFLPYTGVGLIILGCLLVWSRLAVFYAVVGYLSGILFMQGLGMDTRPEVLGYIGFNFVFCGIALGGVLLVPSRSSLLLVMLGSCICVIVAEAVRMVLFSLGIPPLALPLNLVILSVLYALKCRPRIDCLFETPFDSESPEIKFHRFAVERARFPDASLPHLQLPFFGERTVTQGFNGNLTHRGEWSEALDFEILDEQGNKFSHLPLDLEGSYVYGTPVLAPCHGTVVKVINNVPDNAVGEINVDRNWGNLIIMRSEGGWHVKLCHLLQGSIKVAEGVRVTRGEVIGHCGNSGRSPAPHLHMQVQQSGLVGGHTVPFRLVRYFTSEDVGLLYHSSGVPDQDWAVSPAGFDLEKSLFFEFGETSWISQFNGHGETIKSSFNDTGDCILSSMNAELTVRIKEQVFQSFDYKGGADSPLLYVYLGLVRVPIVFGDNIYWHDRVDPRPLLRPWAVVLLDMAGPFIGYPMVDVESCLSRNTDGSLNIRSSLKSPFPRGILRSGFPTEIDICISAEGIVRIDSG